MNFFDEKFNFKPLFTSEELFSKVIPTHKSSFSKCAFSSLKHLQADLFSIPRVTLINWQPLVFRPSLMTL